MTDEHESTLQPSDSSSFQQRLYGFLGGIQNDKAVQALIAALDEPDTSTVERAAASLLVTQDADGLTALINRSTTLPVTVIEKMQQESSLFQQVAIRMTSSPVRQDRVQAIQFLETTGSTDAIPTLTRLMSSQDKEIRSTALQTVESLVDTHLEAFSETPQDSSVREQQSHKAKQRLERITILDALSEALRTFNVHHNAEIIRLAFTMGSISDQILRPYISGFSQLATKIREIIHSDCTELHVGFVLRMLHDDSQAIKVQARLLLSQFDAERFTPAFESYALTLPKKELFKLADFDGELPWWPMIVDHVGQTSDAFRDLLIEMAYFVKEQRDVIRLCDAIIEHGPPPAKFDAVNLLQKTGNIQAWSTLSKVFDTDSRDLQLHTFKLFMDAPIEHRMRLLAPLINAGDDEIRHLASKAVSAISVDRYLKSFSSLDPSYRLSAAQALLKIDPDLVTELGKTLESMDPSYRLHAVQLLQLLERETEAEAALMKLIADPDSKVRASVVKAIGVLGTVPAVKAVLASLKDPDRRVRANAVEALEALQHPQVRTMILPLLEHPDNRIRGNATKALLLMGEPAARLALESMMHDADSPMMRRTAIWVLRESHLPDAMKKLQTLSTGDPDPGVRDKAADAIVEMKSREEDSDD